MRRFTALHPVLGPPLKVLYVMDALDGKDPGGTERQLVELIARLDPERVEPRLALFRSTAAPDERPAFPCPVDLLGIGSLRDAGSAARLVRLARFVRKEQVDVVHVLLNDAAVAVPFFAWAGGAAVVASRRDMGFWYTRSNLAALRVSNRFVNTMITNSEAVRWSVHTRERFPMSRIEVVYNGHDPARFEAPAEAGFRERLGIGASDPIIGMVANFHPWKRHVDLLNAFAIVRGRHPRAHLVLAGGGSMESCRERVRELGIDSAVHFLGPITDAIPVVKHFSIGILCSESEGLSNAVIEYMGCGKPAVCTNVGGNLELVDEGKTGFLVRPFDVEALAARAAALLDSPASMEQMGVRARAAAQRFTTRRMADAHMVLYEQAVRSRWPRPAHAPVWDRPDPA